MHTLKRGVFYASDGELEELQARALKQGVTLSNYVRASLGLSELRRGRVKIIENGVEVKRPLAAHEYPPIKLGDVLDELTVEPVYE